MLAARPVAMVLFVASTAAAPFHAAEYLGTAGSYAVLGGTAVTCSSSTIAGDVGVNSGAVGACTVLGTVHQGDLAAQQAYADFLASYDSIADNACGQALTGSLAGMTLSPGVYCFSAGAALTGLLTLDGPSDGIWIFKVGTGGTGDLAATNFTVALSGGTGCYNNVYWWTAQSVTLTDSVLFGRVLAGTDITITRGSLHGQALAKGVVTLTNTSVFIDACPVSEVSPSYAVFPARLAKDASSATGYYLYFQRSDMASGYNLYEGMLGAWYSHGGAGGNECAMAVIDLGTGEMRAAILPSAGDHYYLVTAYAGGQEGPSGFATPHLEIDPVQSTCAP